MFFDHDSRLLRVLVVDPLACLRWIAVLRCRCSRTLAPLDALDPLVTVGFGFTVATVALSSTVAGSPMTPVLVLLAALQLVPAWSTVRLASGRRITEAGGRAAGGAPRWHRRAGDGPCSDLDRDAITSVISTTQHHTGRPALGWVPVLGRPAPVSGTPRSRRCAP